MLILSKPYILRKKRMETISLNNGNLVATIHLLGAEVRSIINLENNHEYMWNGNPEIWSGVSPVLFPVVGKTTDGRVTYKEQQYPLGNHGFARHLVFTVEKHQTDEVTLLLITNSNETSRYPFNLEFRVIYRLVGKSLTTTYSVRNIDKQTAYFSVGAHPAFRCPFDEYHTLEQYSIEFDQKEDLVQYEINSQAFFTGKTTTCPLHSIELNQNVFDNDAIIFSNIQKKIIRLKESGSDRQISVSFDGFDWLGLWSKPGASYICIEPWCGHSDLLGFDGEIDSKPAIKNIAAGEIWSRNYTITFSY